MKGRMLLAVALLATAPAFLSAQEEIMTLSDPLFTHPTRPPVPFTHARHMEFGTITCTDCHHRFDTGVAPRKNILDPRELEAGNPAVACRSCHRSAGQLQAAFHVLCIDCHERTQHAGKPTGPRLCGECHPA